MQHKVFVYGTLLQGEMRNPVLDASHYLGPVMADGRLIDLGRYPALVEGQGRVIGELYRVSRATLQQLDRIEGHDAGNPSASLYRRASIEIRHFADGHRERVLTYRYPRRANGEPVRHGDYRRYKLERQDVEQWVIAYGSNMCRDRLAARVGEPLDVERGWLSGYALRFNKLAQGGCSVCANIIWRGGVARCPAVAWKLDPDQLATLDLYEGTPEHYLRIALPFEGDHRGWRICQVYIAHPDRLHHGVGPAEDYVAHIRSGYAQNGFESSLP
jgi:gamma-glutamylcyclotransferase (GGCT)/AIG2-like uncharacterized protein YtfP